MVESIFPRVAVVALSTVVGMVFFPACEIRIGPGSGGAAQGDSDDRDDTTDHGDEPQSPEDPAGDADPFAGVDPEELALASAKAGYMAYFAAGMVESHAIDSTLDDEIIAQLFEQYVTMGYQEANQWLMSVELTSLPIPEESNFSCGSRFGCPYKFVDCPLIDPASVCVVTDCGESKCRACPEIFGLNSLAIKAWCAYVCRNGSTVTGLGVIAFSKFRNYQIGPICVPSW